MGRFLKSVIAQEEAITASTVVTYDLPVNPLSFLTFSLAFRDGDALGLAGNPIADALSFISRVEVLYKGQAIMSLSAADLFYLSHIITRKPPSIINLVDASAQQHYLNFILPFGRRLYDPTECFPAVRRGELQLQITYTAAVATVDSPALILASTELLDVTPGRFLKYTTISRTIAAAGDYDIDLPIGNPLAGILLFATTVPTGVATGRSINAARVMVDNVETDYANINWETLWGETMLEAPMDLSVDRHTHAQALATDTTVGQALLGIIGRNRYAYLNFDPNGDGMYFLDTAGRARVHLRLNSDTATDAIRVIPVEIIGAPGAPAAV